MCRTEVQFSGIDCSTAETRLLFRHHQIQDLRKTRSNSVRNSPQSRKNIFMKIVWRDRLSTTFECSRTRVVLHGSAWDSWETVLLPCFCRTQFLNLDVRHGRIGPYSGFLRLYMTVAAFIVSSIFPFFQLSSAYNLYRHPDRYCLLFGSRCDAHVNN